MRRSNRSAAIHSNDRRPHVVYEFWDRFGQPLYVGCTVDIIRRMQQHSGAAWWDRVHEIHTKRYATKRDGQAAELKLIHELQPEFNGLGTIRHNESMRELRRVRLLNDA